jgi:hypothetical protein
VALYLHNQPLADPGKRPTKRGLVDAVNWNLWSLRAWPSLHNQEGEEILLVETWPGGSLISWHAIVTNLLKEPYPNTAAVVRLLADSYELDPDEVRTNPYTKRAPARGWCLAWRYSKPRRINAPRPGALRFRPNGWRRTDDLDPRLLRSWLGAQRTPRVGE